MSLEYPPLTVSLCVEDSAKAIEFYKKAFGATERYRLHDPQSGVVGHAEIVVYGHVIFLADENPQWGNKSPKTFDGSPAKLCLQVADCDAQYQQALDAGATSEMEPADMFYGHRAAVVRDPSGYDWLISQELEKLTPEQMQERWSAMGDACSG